MEDPESPLSDVPTEDFDEDVKHDDRSISMVDDSGIEHEGRPAKRQRTSGAKHRAPVADSHDYHTFGGKRVDQIEEYEISEDTDGSVPASPTHHSHGGIGGRGQEQDEDSLAHEQISVCKWDGCTFGDLGNMDKLVEHLHDDHIGTRQKKYSCEWVECNRKGIPHASGYALRAHMRSHTREKPFYCSLPECDRSFTRSDALAKHMRTVHETEALRPSDPVPKHHSSNPTHKFQRLRLVFNKGQDDGKSSATPQPASPLTRPPGTGPILGGLEYEHNNITYLPPPPSDPDGPPQIQFPVDIRFDDDEALLPANELYKVLRRQLHWAQEEAEDLKRDVDRLEQQRKQEWMEKELLLENTLEAEQVTMQQKKGDITFSSADGRPGEPTLREKMQRDVEPSKRLKLVGKAVPWWRKDRVDAPVLIKDGDLEREVIETTMSMRDEDTVENIPLDERGPAGLVAAVP